MPEGLGSGAPVTGVLLAAGAGTRLGRGPKALLRRRGVSLVEGLARELAEGGCREVVVVLGCAADRVIAATDLAGYRVVVNDDWADGLSSSLKRGVNAVTAGSDVLIALVDQPGITAGLIERLRRNHRPGRITAAGFRRDAGRGSVSPLVRRHPIVFDARLACDAAESSSGNEGARGYLLARSDLVDVIDCSDLDDGRDIDVEVDLELIDDRLG